VQISQEGNQISVLAHWVADATGGDTYAFQVDLGALPVGQYTVTYSQGPSVGNASFHYVVIGFSVSAEGYATAVEYFAPSLGHYFVTSDSAEIAALDNGTIPGWTRTGESFHVIPAAAQPTTAVSVCRFYGLPQAGLNSHFFTSFQSECDAVQQLWPNAWLLETADAFAVLPVPLGDCDRVPSLSTVSTTIGPMRIIDSRLRRQLGIKWSRWGGYSRATRRNTASRRCAFRSSSA
jgi:hypothetical protein